MDTTQDIAVSAERFHYYDQHPTPEDLMGESAAQDQLLLYLVQVLSALLHNTPVYIARNLNIYTQRIKHQVPIVPDLALFDIALTPTVIGQLRSWRMYEPNRPPPRLVIEIASDTTWRTDLYEKPTSYDTLGVTEYVLYDPNIPKYLPGSRLRVWRRSEQQFLPVPPAADGTVWSETLASWLVPDRGMLRLRDAAGATRLTAYEAEQHARQAERRARQAERRARQAAQREKEAERAAKEAEQREKEAERAAKERAWAKLRELGIDPEQL